MSRVNIVLIHTGHDTCKTGRTLGRIEVENHFFHHHILLTATRVSR